MCWMGRPVWWCPPGVPLGVALVGMLFGLTAGLAAVFTTTESRMLAIWAPQLDRVVWAAWPPALVVVVVWAALRWWTMQYVVDSTMSSAALERCGVGTNASGCTRSRGRCT